MSADRRVYLHLLSDDGAEAWMKFRLVYEGELRPSGNDAGPNAGLRMAEHKQTIRKVFHEQLKALWADRKNLSEWEAYPSDYGLPAGLATNSNGRMPYRDIVAALHPHVGYHFVPLVREKLSLLCELHVLFLRRDRPGGVLHAGDIDNRVKTLIDALRMPKSTAELGAAYATPAAGEEPFYVLMEEDKLVSAFSVDTDLLLIPPKASDREIDLRWSMVIVSVELKPYVSTNAALSFL
jgi:hypothetical protein